MVTCVLRNAANSSIYQVLFILLNKISDHYANETVASYTYMPRVLLVDGGVRMYARVPIGEH